MQDNIFTVKDLSFAYGKQKVLDDLALTLHEGTITTLIGANGCGKSTLFNLMTKNLKPDSGEIFLRDKNIADLKLKEFAREAAIVHQYNTAPMDISVEKLVSYGRTPYHTMGLSPNVKKDEEKVNWAMETQTQGGIPAIRRTKTACLDCNGAGTGYKNIIFGRTYYLFGYTLSTPNFKVNSSAESGIQSHNCYGSA